MEGSSSLDEEVDLAGFLTLRPVLKVRGGAHNRRGLEG